MHRKRFFACIDTVDTDTHDYSQAVVDGHLHCFSPPATHSNMDILRDDAEAHKLMQLAYSGAFLQESNTHCWQLPGPHGTRHAVSSLQEIINLQGTATPAQSAADLAGIVVSPDASASVPWQDFMQRCTSRFQQRRPAVCDRAGLNSAADKSLPKGNLALQPVAEQWIPYLASENLFSHLVEHLHEGRVSHPFTAKQQAHITIIANEALHPGCNKEDCMQISQGQPFRRSILQLFAAAAQDPDMDLCIMLE